MNGQMDIFSLDKQQFKINKPVRLIECFAGYGSQALSLKYLGVPFEHHKICEWAVKSIQAYKDLHMTEDNTDYSKDLTLQQIYDFLFERGISANYNEPMTREQISRLGEKARTIYNNIKATHNLVSVCNVKGEDLEITDTDKYTYMLTYSFPCQDLSNAGLKKGMEKGSGTRSGLLWEIERILSECESKPQILIMENVPEVIGTNNKPHFDKWVQRLDEWGYYSKWQVINGTDFEMPQNRKRCFMVSILGDYYYNFPNPTGCKLRLKDLLEPTVDEKYYLKKDIIEYFIRHTQESKEKGNGFKFEPTIDGDVIAKCITTRAGGRMDDNFIAFDEQNQRLHLDGTVGTLTTDGNSPKHNNRVIEILDNIRIRKLTPRECFRLMGVKDEDFDKIAKNQSDTSLYHLAGDSIITNCLIATFREMIGEDYGKRKDY